MIRPMLIARGKRQNHFGPVMITQCHSWRNLEVLRGIIFPVKSAMSPLRTLSQRSIIPSQIKKKRMITVFGR